jgi:hypothetical protein
MDLPDLLASDEAFVSAVAATLPIRFAISRAAVATLGVLAWRTTRIGRAGAAENRVWRGFGWVVLALALASLFALIPMPVVFAVWAIALTVQHARTVAPPPGDG